MQWNIVSETKIFEGNIGCEWFVGFCFILMYEAWVMPYGGSTQGVREWGLSLKASDTPPQSS